jgi:aminopeptidase N
MRGSEEIQFELKASSDPVILDFRDLSDDLKPIEGTINDVRVNGVPLGSPTQVNGHILFPAGLFHSGENTISLKFESGIAAAGRPITRFLDRDDGSEYVYTLFVPMDASLAFPCFDQPDLKGKFTLELTAPKEWQVISNGMGTPRPPGADGFKATAFTETPPISTYLFAFAAGPFLSAGTTLPRFP